jgi:uracil DNA glycosylase
MYWKEWIDKEKKEDYFKKIHEFLRGKKFFPSREMLIKNKVVNETYM